MEFASGRYNENLRPKSEAFEAKLQNEPKRPTNFHGPVVKRLRHRPFTAVSGVRFPSGSPIVKDISKAKLRDIFCLQNWNRTGGLAKATVLRLLAAA